MTNKELPQSFLQFLKTNGIDPDAYTRAITTYTVPRFLRINPRFPIPITELARQLEIDASCIAPVSYMPDFVQLNVGREIAVAQIAAYRTGQVVGMDVSSGVAVAALDIQPDNHCLDLCAAPGAKLCMMASKVDERGSVTGVDIDRQRLSACMSLVRKLRVKPVRLFLGDSTLFDIPSPDLESTNPFSFPTSDLTSTTESSTPNSSNKRQQEQPYHTTKRLKPGFKLFFSTHALQTLPTQGTGYYDRVMVDAECSHEGSARHILKFEEWGWDTFERRFLDAERIASLQTLQRDLLTRGFSLLRPGGILVYATCSFAKAQNEDIVQWFLAQHEEDAELVPVPREFLPSDDCYSKLLPGSVRFSPETTATSGLFLAKIVKKQKVEKKEE